MCLVNGRVISKYILFVSWVLYYFFSQGYFPISAQCFQASLIMRSPQLKTNVQIPAPGEADTLELGQKSCIFNCCPRWFLGKYRTECISWSPHFADWGKMCMCKPTIKITFSQVIACLNSITHSSELTVG